MIDYLKEFEDKGFFTCADILNESEREELLSNIDQIERNVLTHPENKKEMDLSYSFLSDPLFIKTQEINNKTAWVYLKSHLKPFSPDILIDACVKNSAPFEFEHINVAPRKEKKIACFFCDEVLATNLLQRGNFIELKCDCRVRCVHFKCGNTFIMNNPKCMVCSKYFEMRENSQLKNSLKF